MGKTNMELLGQSLDAARAAVDRWFAADEQVQRAGDLRRLNGALADALADVETAARRERRNAAAGGVVVAEEAGELVAAEDAAVEDVADAGA
jgi:hypothetical protein